MGTAMGAISRLISRPLQGNSARARPTAASVPRAVAMTVAAGATMALLRGARGGARAAGAARPQDEKKKRRHPGGGGGGGGKKKKKNPPENDSGTITRM